MVADKGREIARRGCHVVASCVNWATQTKQNPPYRIDKTGLLLVAGARNQLYLLFAAKGLNLVKTQYNKGLS